MGDSITSRVPQNIQERGTVQSMLKFAAPCTRFAFEVPGSGAWGCDSSLFGSKIVAQGHWVCGWMQMQISKGACSCYMLVFVTTTFAGISPGAATETRPRPLVL